MDIEAEDVAFGKEAFGVVEIGDIGGDRGFGMGEGEGVFGFEDRAGVLEGGVY